MTERRRHALLVVAAAGFVFVVAHGSSFGNAFEIADDARQQLYWMQRWDDPELYRDDLLTRYAEHYVPWGVRALFAVGSQCMHPFVFSKLLTGALFVLTVGFLFGLGLQFKDPLTAVTVACAPFLFGNFLQQASGGLSRGFVYPLMAAYLLCIARDKLVWAGLLLVLQSVFNPYCLLACLAMHAVFVVHRVLGSKLRTPTAASHRTDVGVDGTRVAVGSPSSDASGRRRSRGALVASCVLAVAAAAIAIVGHVARSSPEFGELVSGAEMRGHDEYTKFGRYPIVPVPSLAFELILPWAIGGGPAGRHVVVGVVLTLAVLGGAVWSLRRNRTVLDIAGLRVLVYALIAATLAYAAARVFLLKLFLPQRYVEYPLHLIQAVLLGLALRGVLGWAATKRHTVPVIVALFALFGALRMRGDGLRDCSEHAALSRFLETTPKSAMLAGHPRVMDDVVTFAKRRAFVTYELSHTWYDRYWSVIKQRTFDFFDAYYSDEPSRVRAFCRENGIDYLVVREADFPPIRRGGAAIYFQPFQARIRERFGSSSRFALLDTAEFPPLFDDRGVRVVRAN